MAAPARRFVPLAALALSACVPDLHSPDTGGSDWTPPDNSWPANEPPADLVGEGYSQGQVMPDFLLMDQHGDMVSLWQFYGMVVVVDVSTMWCAPCAEIADGVDETWNAYRDQGFIYLTILPETEQGTVPEQEDLQRWASDHSITAPILSDDQGLSYTMVPDTAWPRVMVVDRDMTIAVDRVSPVEDAAIQAAIESVL